MTSEFVSYWPSAPGTKASEEEVLNLLFHDNWLVELSRQYGHVAAAPFRPSRYAKLLSTSARLRPSGSRLAALPYTQSLPEIRRALRENPDLRWVGFSDRWSDFVPEESLWVDARRRPLDARERENVGDDPVLISALGPRTWQRILDGYRLDDVAVARAFATREQLEELRRHMFGTSSLTPTLHDDGRRPLTIAERVFGRSFSPAEESPHWRTRLSRFFEPFELRWATTAPIRRTFVAVCDDPKYHLLARFAELHEIPGAERPLLPEGVLKIFARGVPHEGLYRRFPDIFAGDMVIWQSAPEIPMAVEAVETLRRDATSRGVPVRVISSPYPPSLARVYDDTWP